MRKFLITSLLLFLILYSKAQNAELLFQQTEILIKNGKLYKNETFEIKILNKNGEKYGHLKIPYSNMVKLNSLKASILDENKNVIRNINKNEITDKSSFSNYSFYEDNYVKEIRIAHNSYPYIIKYSYELQQNEFLNIDFWLPVIDLRIPTQNAELKLTTPSDYKINYINKNIANPETDTLDSQIIYRWSTKYKNIVKDENLSPPITEFLPSVTILPIDFKFEIDGSMKTWTDYGNWQNNLLEGINEIPEDEAEKIRDAIKGLKNDYDKIKILYHYLQDKTRYINISIETGGLKPYPASYVAKNNYGDCKALTNYFKSVLELVGIKSYYSKINAGNPITTINKNIPSQQFNHVILLVPVENDSLWIDCTSECAFNYLGTFCQNRDVFIIDKNNSHFSQTPELQINDVSEIRTIFVSFLKNNEYKLTFRDKFKGNKYEQLTTINKDYTDIDKKRIIQNLFVEDNQELKEFSIEQECRDSLFIYLNYVTTTHNFFNRYGNEILAKNIPLKLPEMETPEKRKLPIQINYPVSQTDTIIYEIPVGYTASLTNDTKTITNSYGEYNFSFEILPDKVILMKQFNLNAGYFPLNEYSTLYNLINEIRVFENKTSIILTSKTQ